MKIVLDLLLGAFDSLGVHPPRWALRLERRLYPERFATPFQVASVFREVYRERAGK